MRMLDGDQRVLPPASASAALSIERDLDRHAAARCFGGRQCGGKTGRALADDNEISRAALIPRYLATSAHCGQVRCSTGVSQAL